MTARVVAPEQGGGGKGASLYNYAGGSVAPPGYTVAWTASIGSFAESYAPTTTFLNVSNIEGPTQDLTFWAEAVRNEGPGSVLAHSPLRPIKLNFPSKSVNGRPQASATLDDIKSDLAAAMRAPDRDARVERLRAALARRAGDPLAIVLEFNIAVLLGQNPDPNHHQGVHPEQSLAVLQHIVQHYDHKAYYQANAVGEACSPSLMVPRAAIMAASIYNGYLHDGSQARADTIIAMEALDWTFRQRTKDWANAPQPAPPFAFNDTLIEQAKYKSCVAQWEKEKRLAAAGQAIGPYEMAMAEAAVRQYGLSYGPQRPEQVAPIMKRLIARFPGSPIATAAQNHINRARVLAGYGG